MACLPVKLPGIEFSFHNVKVRDKVLDVLLDQKTLKCELSAFVMMEFKKYK